MIEEMAAASAAEKLGSATMAAVATLTVSATDCGLDWLCGGWPKTRDDDEAGRGLDVRVRSKVTVGKGADAEMVTTPDEEGMIALASGLLGFVTPSLLVVEPDNSMAAAAEMVDAIAMAAGGRGWL
ncbi:hypothetical protein BHE74_00011439 [Ensete ventricosum]|nr:hypothetical protein GW17_00009362 [Ensete ventricosum]RWW80231.1 hypothetical protein BHE74_00011439 [Ensete ventricosum]RZR90799.1 hypothetical protein BHM03_00018779 [Ensete ventricosum]